MIASISWPFATVLIALIVVFGLLVGGLMLMVSKNKDYRG